MSGINQCDGDKLDRGWMHFKEAATVAIARICFAQYQSVASPLRLCSLQCIFVALNTSLNKHDM